MPADGLEIRGPARALLDDPLLLRLRGAGGASAAWRARFRDDDGRVWRATAPRAEELPGAWTPAKPALGPLAALRSLRPVEVEVRAELPDGRAATRTLTQVLMGDGVRLRRWRDGLSATLHLPGEASGATVLLDATGDDDAAAAATLAAPLLGSRGVVVLALSAGSVEVASERLAAVPGAAAAPEVVRAGLVPPGVAMRDPQDHDARAAAWDDLLARLGARPRAVAPA
jgi:hypothetical protein